MRSGRGPRVVCWALIAGSVLLSVGCSKEDPEPAATPRLQVGDRAPGFELRSASGGEVSLAGLIEKRPVLLYFSMGPG